MNIKKVVLAIVLFFTIFSLNSYAEETWKIASLNWEPYSGAEISNQGNSIQKLRELLKKEGISLIVEFYPWKRAQNKAKTVGYIGYFPAWPEEVTEGFVASLPVDWSSISVLKKTGNAVDFTNMDELFSKYKVGVVSTYVYPEAISIAMKKYLKHTDGSQNEVALLKKLAAGRDEVAITDPNVMMYLAEKRGVSSIEAVKQVMQKELVVALRDDVENKKRIDLLNKLLKEQMLEK